MVIGTQTRFFSLFVLVFLVSSYMPERTTTVRYLLRLSRGMLTQLMNVSSR